MKKARFLIPAEHEMVDSMLYYQHQAKGLGRDFLDQVTEAVRRFPFALLYKISGDEVVILAVMHLKRHPSYWRDR